MGDNFDPDNVTHALSVLPTESWRKNECVYNMNGNPKTVRQYTNWGYQTATIETLDINIPIEILQRTFIDKVGILIDLKKQYSLSFSIDIVINVENNESPSVCLQGFILDLAVALNARIDIDMYITN